MNLFQKVGTKVEKLKKFKAHVVKLVDTLALGASA